MGKFIKVALSIAVGLILFGGVLFVGAMALNGWDFTKLGTVKYVTNTYEVGDEFNGISINTVTADVTFVKSQDGACKVVCFEEEKVKHSVSVQDGTLGVNAVDEKKWYEYVGINFTSPKITVYLPESEYSSLQIVSDTGDVEIPNTLAFSSVDVSVSTGDVKCTASVSGLMKIKTSTGDIRVENVSVNALELSASTGDVCVLSTSSKENVKVTVSTGRVRLTDVSCKAISCTGSTGDFVLTNVIASGSLSIKVSTGDVSFERCDAAEIYVKASTGDVRGSFRSNKTIIAESDTGKVNVPNNTVGGRCEIITDTGDIKIQIVE